MKENGTGAKKYVEVNEVIQFADVFFADPILRIATRSLLAAAPAAAPIVEREARGTEKDCLTKMLLESPSLCTLYGTRESFADEADWLLDEGVAVPVRCKECTQWGGVAFGNVCRRWSAPFAGMKNCTGPDDYCSYGERKIANPQI